MTFSKLGTDTDTGQLVYLPRTARTKGLYIVGLQGMGKSGLMENLIMEDINQQIGVCVIDPKRELIDNVAARVPANREKDVIYLDISDMLSFFGLPLLDYADLQNELSVEKTRSQFLHVFAKAFGITDATPVMYTLLSNIAYTLIANPRYTMIDIRQLLTNKTCRERLLQNRFLLEHKPNVVDYWHTHYDKLSPQRQDEESFNILNKLNDFENAPLRYIVGQSRSTIDLQTIMDEGKILLVKLDRQMEQATSLVGSIIVALILNASASRRTHRPFHLYADEFQRFATEDFATLLEEARYADIGITMAHQNRSQLESSVKRVEEQLKDRTLNVGSIVVFYVPTDASELAGQFDTTTQPAWEEELEEESVEVLEEEWFERVEEEVIDGTEPILTPRSDAIDWLLAGRTHGHPTVNTFISKWNIKTIEQVKQGKDQRRQEAYWQQRATQFLDDLNRLAYEAMLYKNADNLSINPEFIDLLYLFLHQDLGYYHFFSTALRKNVQQQMTLFSLISTSNPTQWGTLIDREYYKEIVLSRLERAVSAAEESAPLMTTLTNIFHRYEPHIDTAWLINLNLNCLQWELREEITKEYTITSWGEKYFKDVKTMHSRLVKGQETNWYTPYSFEREIKRLMTSPTAPRVIIASFLADLLAILRVLAIDEFAIRDKSGLEQLHKRTQINILTHPRQTITHPRKVIMHPQQTRAEKQKENENQLLRPDPYRAFVKMIKNDPQNPGKTCLKCNLRNANGGRYCIDCNTKLPAPNEYIIETLPPTKGLYGNLLQERIARIQVRNIQDGILSNRADVEAEILQRQTSCSSGSAPVQPKHPSSQPQPSHARQVPVQGNCPNCGSSKNPSEARFCMQCGTKLN